MSTAPAIAPLDLRPHPLRRLPVPWIWLTGTPPEPKRYTRMTAEGLEIARAATEAMQRTAARQQKPQPQWTRRKVEP